MHTDLSEVLSHAEDTLFFIDMRRWPYVPRRAPECRSVSLICPMGCTMVISNAHPAVKKMSAYIFCSAVTRGEISCGKGSARVSRVSPLYGLDTGAVYRRRSSHVASNNSCTLYFPASEHLLSAVALVSCT
jgi:hypothetical protein